MTAALPIAAQPTPSPPSRQPWFRVAKSGSRASKRQHPSAGGGATIGPSTDQALVDRARLGDLDAFEAIVRSRIDRVYRVCLAVTGDDAEAADAARETLLTAWRELPRLRDPERFDAWLGRIVLSRSRIALRRGRRGVRELPAWLVTAGPAPGDGVRLAEALDRLNPDQRALLALHHLDVRPVAELADVFDTPVGTAESRLETAHRTLDGALGTASVWDDARLRRAFVEQFARRAPDALTASIVHLARSEPRRRRARLDAAWTPPAAAVAMSLAIALVLVGPDASARPTASPGPTASASVAPSRTPRATPAGSVTPTPDPIGFPDTVLGLPVISVSEAIARRDAALDDSELAVRGYLPEPGPMPSCPAPVVTPSPLEPRCDDRVAGEYLASLLMERPDRIWESPGYGQTRGPAVETVLRPEVPRAVGGDEEPATVEPVPVILVGHFDDYRAGLCPEDAVHECRRKFVIDARVWVAGATAGRGLVDLVADREPMLPPDHARAIAGLAARAAGAPWLAVVDGPGLRGIDPRAAEVPGLAEADQVWVVRQLVESGGRRVARTRFVVDATGQLFTAGADGIETNTSVVDERSHAPFPEETLGIPVIGVSEALARRQTGEFGERAAAVRGYLVVPPPNVACREPRTDLEPIPPEPGSCGEDARLWLLGASQPPWATVDGERRWSAPFVPTINLVVRPESHFFRPRDFDVDAAPAMVPVVVLGHLFDSRLPQTNLDMLVVDALLWTDGLVEPDRTNRLDRAPADDRAAVEARIEAQAGPAVRTWSTVLAGPRLPEVDPELGQRELADAELVWRVTRLVVERGQPVLRVAWTPDGSDRVWLGQAGGWAQLQPSHRIALGIGVSLAVIDDADLVVDVRAAGAADPPGAIRVPGDDVNPEVVLSNPGDDERRLRISWIGSTCQSTWQLLVVRSEPRPALNMPYDGQVCPDSGLRHAVVVTFSRPMPAAEVEVRHILCCG